MKKPDLLFFALILCAVSLASQANDRVPISAFASEQLAGWQHKSFSGTTNYQLINMGADTVLKAESRASASGLLKKQRVDLRQTPYLNWRWRIENRLKPVNEQQKSGDDYAARVYVICNSGWRFWETKSINYVWSNTSSKHSIWPNAFAGKHAMMFALRSSEAPTGVWLYEKRNVFTDLQRLYGETIRYIDAVALMTDTDNAGDQATSYYADIYFSRN